MANCGTDKTNYENYETCRNTDWMYISGGSWWIISSNVDKLNFVWNVHVDGYLNSSIVNLSDYASRPSVYLKSDITFSGSGTMEDPFTIV